MENKEKGGKGIDDRGKRRERNSQDNAIFLRGGGWGSALPMFLIDKVGPLGKKLSKGVKGRDGRNREENSDEGTRGEEDGRFGGRKVEERESSNSKGGGEGKEVK